MTVVELRKVLENFGPGREVYVCDDNVSCHVINRIVLEGEDVVVIVNRENPDGN
jgi:hypothetical protein